MKTIDAPARGFVVEWEMGALGKPTTRFTVADLQRRSLTVLLVTYDAQGRERIGSWLSEEGHDVIQCPGPSAPDYTCLGGKGRDCPLTKVADVVVLDLNLASDAVLAGTPSWRLLDYYLEKGHPVVAIAGPEQMGLHFLDEKVITVERPVDREMILTAVDRAVTKRSTVMDIGTFRWTPRRQVRRPY